LGPCSIVFKAMSGEPELKVVNKSDQKILLVDG
jgi:hypothetical protein